MMSASSSCQKRGEKRGFTLIETLIAITILTMSVGGPLFVADRALVAAETARDNLIANHLAAEAIEYVRTMRDREFLVEQAGGGTNVSVDAWKDFVFGTGGISDATINACMGKTCTVDPFASMGVGAGLSLTTCTTNCGPLYMQSNGYYRQSNVGGSSTQTIFTRMVKPVLISSNDLQLTSTVSWSFHGTTYQVSAVDHLTPWQ